MVNRGTFARTISALGVAIVASFALVVSGCSKTSQESGAGATDSKYVLQQEPAAAQEVKAAHAAAENGAEVVLVGRIGGGHDPWIKDRAAFTIVDNSLQACSDIPGDECSTPWDYCCVTDQLPGATALVKVVDASGRLVAVDARQLLGVKELDRVVVHGRTTRDENGNLTVLADGVYVKQ